LQDEVETQRSEKVVYYGNNNQNNDQNNENNRNREKITFKDMLAIAIAQFLILGPIILGAIFVFFLLLLFVSKVWLRG
jgi:hypothetical protein